MKKNQSFFKKAQAVVLVLALLVSLAFPLQGMQVVAETNETETTTDGKIVAQNYELSNGEKGLISSGLLTGNTHTYLVPDSDDGLITVDSGIEKENATKAEKEILNQLDIMKQNLFTDEEFQSSIKSITDSFKSYNDSQGLLDAWYSLKIVKDRLISPEEAVQEILNVTRNDVVYAARGVKLHTVYKLLPNDKEVGK